jgi:hypothetical protein
MGKMDLVGELVFDCLCGGKKPVGVFSGVDFV